jgi:hypothetical protein
MDARPLSRDTGCKRGKLKTRPRDGESPFCAFCAGLPSAANACLRHFIAAFYEKYFRRAPQQERAAKSGKSIAQERGIPERSEADLL